MEEVLIIFAIPDHVGLSLVFGRMLHVTKFTSKDICALVCVNSRHFLTLTWPDSHLTGDLDKGLVSTLNPGPFEVRVIWDTGASKTIGGMYEEEAIFRGANHVRIGAGIDW